jgi:HK97 family phage portal protein
MWPFNWFTGYRPKLTEQGTSGEPSVYWPNASGPTFRVTPGGSLALPAAWACVRLRSRVVGSLPMSLINKVGDKRTEAVDHWLYGLLHESPNADQTPYEFWSGMVGCLDLWGNGYAEKGLGALGRTTSLTPLNPEGAGVMRNSNGARVYRFNDRGKAVTLPEEKVFHLRGLTLGGDVGLSAIAAGAQSFSAAMATESTAAGIVDKGLQVAGFMETGSTKLAPDQRQDLVSIFDAFTGSNSAGKIMPLEKDMKFVPLRMNPQEAQLLEARGWNVEDICRWFDTPPILIGHSPAGQTMWGSGIEQIFLGWLTMGLNPLFVSIEQAARKQLLPPAERKLFKPEFNRSALLATDSAGRAALYSSFGQGGIMTRNEMRAKENLPPLPGGDILTVQSALVPLASLGEAQTPDREAQQALMKWLGLGIAGNGQPFPADTPLH